MYSNLLEHFAHTKASRQVSIKYGLLSTCLYGVDIMLIFHMWCNVWKKDDYAYFQIIYDYIPINACNVKRNKDRLISHKLIDFQFQKGPTLFFRITARGHAFIADYERFFREHYAAIQSRSNRKKFARSSF